jgi:hypothetical protein
MSDLSAALITLAVIAVLAPLAAWAYPQRQAVQARHGARWPA